MVVLCGWCFLLMVCCVLVACVAWLSCLLVSCVAVVSRSIVVGWMTLEK